MRLASDALEWPRVRPLHEFLHSVRDGLAAVVAMYRERMTPVNGGDQWLVADGPTDAPA
jgi:hypothetical protein